ncbi:MAG: hypothetical protein JWN46_4029 [Acidimicrobiales bacterium]|nr:hypothetical protein [Acidimicrobiales bacterium]
MTATDQPQSPDVVQLLTEQHQEVRRLFQQVSEAAPGGREEVFQCLVRLLAAHETAEEEVVHPAVRRAEGADEIVRQRLEEEDKAKQALADLEKIGVDSPEFEARLNEFRQMVETHASNEEEQEFRLLREMHDDETLRTMAEALEAAEKVAPTHPHPHSPESALGNLVVGPFAAVADRVRDAIRGRK